MMSPARIVGLFAILPMALIANPRNCLSQGHIYLRGVVPAHCSIAVSVFPAASVRPLTAAGLRRIEVGTILQNCNQRTGFTLTAASADGTPAPAGAEVFDAVPLGVLPYSVESDKPATGSGVAGKLIVNGTSTLYVNFFMN